MGPRARPSQRLVSPLREISLDGCQTPGFVRPDRPTLSHQRTDGSSVVATPSLARKVAPRLSSLRFPSSGHPCSDFAQELNHPWEVCAADRRSRNCIFAMAPSVDSIAGTLSPLASKSSLASYVRRHNRSKSRPGGAPVRSQLKRLGAIGSMDATLKHRLKHAVTVWSISGLRACIR
jgi:hypothetical protein